MVRRKHSAPTDHITELIQREHRQTDAIYPKVQAINTTQREDHVTGLDSDSDCDFR